ncbi:FmdB family zinc ribbon protein [Agarivorans sp. QJM3NY_25]|uniref:FmdB family zinc ribbon protein n=1 Tax=Agarivorans sp. QJM3NY_25 TaxID=3421430 RepID=UPI003D7CB1B8
MPVYDYKCAEHGAFYQLAALDDCAKPAACPQCNQLAPRVIILPPTVLDMAAETKQAIARNEQARHEPQHSTVDSRAENTERLKKGCGCQHHKRGASKLFYTAKGEKMFPSMRPWMISH